MKRKKVLLDGVFVGEPGCGANAGHPVIAICGRDRKTFLWIGSARWFYGILSAPETLRLAESILAAMKPKKKKRKTK